MPSEIREIIKNNLLETTSGIDITAAVGNKYVYIFILSSLQLIISQLPLSIAEVPVLIWNSANLMLILSPLP